MGRAAAGAGGAAVAAAGPRSQPVPGGRYGLAAGLLPNRWSVLSDMLSLAFADAGTRRDRTTWC